VRAGGTDVSATLSGGFQDVFGVASEATIDFGDSQLIESGGLAISTMILSGGIETVAAGGLDSFAHIIGEQHVYGITSGNRIATGGAQTVESGGVASNTTGVGGQLFGKSGGSAVG